MHADEFDHLDRFPAPPGPWVNEAAYEAVGAVVSDDHNAERGRGAARAVVEAVLAEAGPEGLTDMAVELSLKLAEALERIAAEQGLAAVDLTEVWFVD
jgi:hypothetical protein